MKYALHYLLMVVYAFVASMAVTHFGINVFMQMPDADQGYLHLLMAIALSMLPAVGTGLLGEFLRGYNHHYSEKTTFAIVVSTFATVFLTISFMYAPHALPERMFNFAVAIAGFILGLQFQLAAAREARKYLPLPSFRRHPA